MSFKKGYVFMMCEMFSRTSKFKEKRCFKEEWNVLQRILWPSLINKSMHALSLEKMKEEFLITVPRGKPGAFKGIKFYEKSDHVKD